METKRTNNRLPGLRWLAVSLIGLASAAALADENVLQEIVVTAQKRTEDVQQVPIAITAISAAMIEQKGITNISQLSNLAPNVNLDAGSPFSGSDTVLSAYIRGIGQDDFAFNLDPGVGVYVDGVYLARSVGANTTMLDVDRVEILKGPQGTLFGRNTIGGAISIVTRDPGNEFTVKGEVTGGAYDRLDTKISMDVPITDSILSTLSLSTEYRDGYQNRIPYVQTNVNGSAGIPDCTTPTCPYVVDPPQAFPAAGYGGSGSTQGGIDKQSMRAKVVFLDLDPVKFTVTADYLHVDQEATPNTVTGINPNYPGALGAIPNLCLLGVTAPFGALCTSPRGGVSPTPTPYPALTPLAPNGVGLNNDGNPYNNYLPYDSRFETNNIDNTYATGNNFSKLENGGIATILDWSLNHDTDLKWINSYRQLKWTTGMNLSGSPEAILDTSFAMSQHQVSEELQMNGASFGNRLTYATGLYYFEEGGYLHDFVTFPMGLLQIDGPNDLETKSEAVYAHLNFKITDQWGITAGARETFDQKTFQGYQTDDNGLSYKISGCVNPSAPNTLGAPPTLTCQQVLGFPVVGYPYDYYPTGPFHLNYNNFSPTLGTEFHLTPDEMLYASFSKGFKSGGWTTRLSDPHPTYDSTLHFNPEYATSYEVGFKSELLDHRLRLNTAAFDTKYKAIQLNSQEGISPTVINAGNATIWGLEAEAQALMGAGFSLNASAGYTKAYYTSLNNVGDNGYLLTLNSCPERNPGAPLPNTANPALLAQQYQNGACNLPKTPKFKSNVGPQYATDLPNGGALQFNADWTYTTTEYNDIGNTWQLARPDMSQVNASMLYKAPSRVWQFVVGATNLTDKRYVVYGQNQGGVAVIDATYNPPREWYATIRYNMGAGGVGK
jgi:iron complex outermembrane receptor protein